MHKTSILDVDNSVKELSYTYSRDIGMVSPLQSASKSSFTAISLSIKAFATFSCSYFSGTNHYIKFVGKE